MSAPFPKSWQEGHVPKTDHAGEHAALIEWEAAEDAARGNVGCHAPGCFDYATGEFGPNYPCDYHRALDLAAIDLDGHDDKRETGAA